jgi:glycolate oxidase iron-sulfur subunit
VHCAVCLPHCPTYALAGDEAESPRGRLALMNAWSRGILSPDEFFWGHLDRCLGCRLCESVCPAEVPYGALLDGLRAAERDAGRPVPRLHRTLGRLAERPRALTALGTLVRGAARLGLRPTSSLVPRPLRSLAALVPDPVPEPWRPPAGVPVRRADGNETALFLGCYARVFRPEPLRALLRVLAAYDRPVVIPPGQTCCGALARHMGETQAAERLGARNRRAFAGARTVVALDTGCLEALRTSLLESEKPFSARVDVLEATRFLDRVLPPRLPAARASFPVVVHRPCTHQSVAGDPDAVFRLLARIGIEAEPWGRGAGCCGAAGSYGLLYPEAATALLQRTLAPLPPDGARVATTNVGCALALAAGLRREKSSAIVIHPIEIIDFLSFRP